MVDPREGRGANLAPFRAGPQADTVTVTDSGDVPVWYLCEGRADRVGEEPLQAAEALCRTRTGDPFLTMEVLYQLS
jgi:hypothetical protein